MITWSQIREQVSSVNSPHASWHSDRKHLLEIIDVAETLNIAPPNASISNLRTIVKSAREAIKTNKTRKLVELFRMAEVHSTHYLRVKCGRELQFVSCSRVDEIIQIDLTQDQFEKFVRTMKNRFEFQLPQEFQMPETIA